MLMPTSDEISRTIFEKHLAFAELTNYRILKQSGASPAENSNGVSEAFSNPSFPDGYAENVVVSSGGPMNSSWSMYCHDVKHTSRSLYSTATNLYVEKWRFNVPDGGWIQDTPVISCDGTIYIGATSYFYAVTFNGYMKWKLKTSGVIWHSSPALDENGIIYFGTWDCSLYAVYPNGTVKWQRTGLGGSIASSPAIGSDGTIYFGTLRDNGQIIAMDQNGNLKWQYFTGYKIVSSPAIGDDGTVYIGSGDDYVYAMNPNGTLRWRFKTEGEIHGDPSIASDGTIYITSYDGYLYALSPNGTQRWKINVGWGSQSNSAIASDGTIYVGGEELYAIFPNGTMKWVFNLGSDRWIGLSSSAISSDGTIYVGVNIGDGNGGEILALNPDGTQRWRKEIAYEGVESSPSIASDGTLYIGSIQNIEVSYLQSFGQALSNVPPNTPIITGPAEGHVRRNISINISSTDDDNNPVSFFIDWGDGTTSGWTTDYYSGETVKYSHIYSQKGTYIIKVKARDTFGAESHWGTHTVTMPLSYEPPHFRFLDWLFERFPHAFPILRQLFNL
jgi:outer membrane protein assembly factor BamB